MSFQAVGSRPRQPLPRPVKPLSWELANHAKAYLEAAQYANGYLFLESLLTAATSISVPAKPYVGYIAPAVQIALASTLIAYPHITTNAESADASKGADAALRYLRSLASTITGPAYKIVRKAFLFPEDRTRRRAPARRSGSQSPGPENDIEQLACIAANAQSIWKLAEDFWHVVGWAFNCSVLHRARWERWKLWLESMLDFLEQDWNACVHSNGDGAAESLIWHYICSQTPTQRSNRRRIIQSIFTMGSAQDQKHFQEVWASETRGPKPKEPIDNCLEKIDIEAGELGGFDYIDDDGLLKPAPTRSRRKIASPSASSHSGDDIVVLSSKDAVSRLGGMEAITLRQRLIALLAEVSETMEMEFASPSVYFDDLTDEIRSLPTIMFELLLSTSQLPIGSQIALNANILLPFVSEQLPDYTKQKLCQEDLEKMFLPIRANSHSFAANAKVSLVLEQLFSHMMREGLLQPSKRLHQSLDRGVNSREKVQGSAKGKKGGDQEELSAKTVLEESSMRLRGLWEILQVAAVPNTRSRLRHRASMKSSSLSLSSAPTMDIEMGE
ncbi:hypothetical protein BS50DRAFT_481739 [Corynespora cassiicola Philippines]|uniref:Uncharacterized protein n=1 Tax=Corynespora cassiicola Philippines TaxID=1448308 RepID=A0A2T2P6W5_CORCC|nr:hypothetical protein BS50DRAFT_481739 [Corynespora cassiicola Philippines]